MWAAQSIVSDMKQSVTHMYVTISHNVCVVCNFPVILCAVLNC